MDIVLNIPITVVVDDDDLYSYTHENMRRIAKLMDEVELNLIVQNQTLETKSQLIYAFNELAIVYLTSNGGSDLIGLYTETYNLPCLIISVKRSLGLIEQKFNKDIVFLTLTKKMRHALLLFFQRNV